MSSEFSSNSTELYVDMTEKELISWKKNQCHSYKKISVIKIFGIHSYQSHQILIYLVHVTEEIFDTRHFRKCDTSVQYYWML